MNELEALKYVLAVALEYMNQNPYGEQENDEPAVSAVKALIGRVEAAESQPSDAICLAVSVLHEKSQYSVRTFLDLSTGHLDKGTRHGIAQGSYDGVITCTPELYGWWLWAGTDEVMMASLPQDLQDVIRYAKQRNCDWIKLDCDAPKLTDLPVYDCESE